MRRLLALGLPTLLLALTPVAACESSSSSSSGGFTPPEAGTFEAGPLPEAAAPPDAAPDAAPLPKGVLVTVLEGGLPKKDVRVLLHDATGAVTGESKTSAAGIASLATAPTMVTVLTSRPVQGGPSDPAPVTFLAVEDGDKLTVTLPDPAPPTPPVVGHYDVSFAGPVVGAVNYNAFVADACATIAVAVDLPITVNLVPGCLAAKNTVLASAYDVNNVVVGAAFAKNVATPAANATANVGPLTFAAPSITTFHATNLPATAAATMGQAYYSLVNDKTFYEAPVGDPSSVAGATIATATGFAEAYQSSVSVRAAASMFSYSGFVRREAPSASPPAFDFATALPFVTGATATGTGRPDVTVDTAAAFAGTDGAALLLVWADATTRRDDTWTFIVPATGTSFKVPALPADAAAFLPTAGAFIDDVTFIEATHLQGYKELKTVPVAPLQNSPIDVVSDPTVPLPAAGTVRFTTWNSHSRG